MATMDGYVRVSRVGTRGGLSFISPAVQRQQIEAWAGLRGVQIGAWHEDLDQSGGKVVRPGLNEALQRCEQGLSAGIVVAKIDRFARSLAGALETISRLEAADATFVSVAEGIDPTTPAGKLMQRLMLSLAEFELDRIREQWATAQQRAVERGVHIASKTPTGYRRCEDGTLEPDPADAPFVADLFAMRASGASWRQLADHLNTNRVESPYRSPHWRPRAVSHILRNRVYLGEARSGRHVNPDAHRPLVDRPTWEAAQHARPTPMSRGQHPAVLAGILRCAGCRYALKPDTMTLRDGTRVRLYRCRGEHAAGICTDRASTLERVVLPVVEQQFLEVAANPAAERVQASTDLADLEALAVEADADLQAFRDDERISEALGVDRYVEGLERRVEAAEDAHRAAAEAKSKTGGLPVHVDLESVWADLNDSERNRLYAAAFGAIMLRSGRTLAIQDRLCFLDDMPDDFPRRGKRFPLRPFDWPPNT